jgi:hypothetical protein
MLSVIHISQISLEIQIEKNKQIANTMEKMGSSSSQLTTYVKNDD